MSIQITQLLDRPVLARVRAAMLKGHFVPFEHSPGVVLRSSIKARSWQGPKPLERASNRLLFHSLKTDTKAQAFCFGRRLSLFEWLLLSQGDYVTAHNESPISSNSQTRADIACLVSLSNEEEYEGGTICIRNNGWQRCLKLSQGMALLYPAESSIEIQKVKKGRLLLVKSHIQSWVSNSDHRYVLQLLGATQQALEIDKCPEDAREHIKEVYQRLLHWWSRG